MNMPNFAIKGEKLANEIINKYNIDLKHYNGTLYFHEILYERDIILILRPIRCEKILGHTLKDKLGTTIMLNSNIRGCRKYFTLAHELAHALHHTSSPIESERNLKSDNKTSVEKEANQFAAHFLLPVKVLVSHIKSAHSITSIHTQTKTSYECIYYQLINVLNYTKLFNYSEIIEMADHYKECKSVNEIKNCELYKAYCIVFDRLYINNKRFKRFPIANDSKKIMLPINLSKHI